MFNIDMDVPVRNTVILDARVLKHCTVEAASELEDEDERVELEDVGGAWHDVEKTSDVEAAAGCELAVDRIYDWQTIHALLSRHAEIVATTRTGKPVDAHIKMRN